ncbi:MAG: hypothetical protein R6U67_15540 [Sodalinema sp.]|uniref:hypothetical protein n=1 Tax=Sodalinema sp. TaxID=3080550 RepID=UPI0011FBE694|nr:MAG: hypothetical protein EYR95_06160 [Phormidium sp. SL48-SHIP]
MIHPWRWIIWGILVSLPILGACSPVTESGDDETPTATPEMTGESTPQPEENSSSDLPSQDTEETEETDETNDTNDTEESIPGDGKTYRHPEGIFEISFPKHYAHQPQANGVSFLSANGEFGGEVTYFETQETLTIDDLEELYRQRTQTAIREMAWQRSELQPDGSVRLDWRGKNASGQDLDAIGYIEQHGDRVYVLNLYGINESYDIYVEDSRLIVGSYQVDRNP